MRALVGLWCLFIALTAFGPVTNAIPFARSLTEDTGPSAFSLTGAPEFLPRCPTTISSKCRPPGGPGTDEACGSDPAWRVVAVHCAESVRHEQQGHCDRRGQSRRPKPGAACPRGCGNRRLSGPGRGHALRAVPVGARRRHVLRPYCSTQRPRLEQRKRFALGGLALVVMLGRPVGGGVFDIGMAYVSAPNWPSEK